MRVGFIGIGAMGWPMAANLARKGFDLTVFDLDPARLARFVGECGGKAAGSIDELAALDMVITMLPTGEHVRRALTEGAFVDAAQAGLVVVDMSSSEPGGTRRLAEVLGPRGIVLVDAPVSGAVPRAEAGTIAIMIGGGDDALVDRISPVLLGMGNKLFRTGPVGSGHAMKALNNVLAATALAASTEALRIAEKFGLDGQTMIDIMNVSTGRNFATEHLIGQHVLAGRFASGFTIGLLAKDAAIAASLAEELDVDAPVVAMVADLFGRTSRRIGGDKDNSAYILGWDDTRAATHLGEVAA